MSTSTKIEWAEKTWNPVIGCSKVSEGCRNCYAIRMSHRLSSNPCAPKYKGLTHIKGGKPEWTNQVHLLEERLLDPFKWRKPARVFVNSMSDLFHEDVPFEFIDRAFSVMALCPKHTFQVLTKRPERMFEYFNRQDSFSRVEAQMRHFSWLNWGPVLTSRMDEWKSCLRFSLKEFPLPNVWLGTSVENQETASSRIPHLLNCPAAVRFLSCEPLLGAVYLTRIQDDEIGARWSALGMGIHWVIVGGESGPDARPMHPDWARSLRDQCVSAGIPFFFKQLGSVLAKELGCKSSKGSDLAELPAYLQVREFPKTFNHIVHSQEMVDKKATVKDYLPVEEESE